MSPSMRALDVGVLVRLHQSHRKGIVIEKKRDPRTMGNHLFKVLWLDGTVGKNVYDYDLMPLGWSIKEQRIIL